MSWSTGHNQIENLPNLDKMICLDYKQKGALENEVNLKITDVYVDDHIGIQYLFINIKRIFFKLFLLFYIINF